MSRKPTIKISYPEASEKALLVTEAMVKRAPGKRVVETESENPIFPDGGELFSGFIRCKTQTGVELTLTLNSSSMDYALETLIKPNLTADEKKRILGEEASGDNLFSPAQAAEAGANTCTKQSAAPRADETIEVGRFTERTLRDILNEMIDTMEKGHGTFDAVNHAIWAIKELTKTSRRDAVAKEGKPIEEDPGLVDQLAVLICGAQRVQPKKTTALRLFANNLVQYLHKGIDDEAVYIVEARELESTISATLQSFTEHPGKELAAALEDLGKRRAMLDPSWDDVEKEAQSLGKPDAEQDGEIEPGLLSDIDEDKSSTAEVRSAPLADEEDKEE